MSVNTIVEKEKLLEYWETYKYPDELIIKKGNIKITCIFKPFTGRGYKLHCITEYNYLTLDEIYVLLSPPTAFYTKRGSWKVLKQSDNVLEVVRAYNSKDKKIVFTVYIMLDKYKDNAQLYVNADVSYYSSKQVFIMYKKDTKHLLPNY